jgi:hypothetical protein
MEMVYSGVVAIIASLVGAFFAIHSAELQRRADAERDRRTASIAHRRAQLNTFYGPLEMERRRSEALRALLPDTEPNGERWRLVHHVGDIRNHLEPPKGQSPAPLPAGITPEQAATVREILRATERAADLVTKNAGMMERWPVAGAYTSLVAHQVRLGNSWSTRTNQTPATSIPFPGRRVGDEAGGGTRETDIDIAITEDCESIFEDLAELTQIDSAEAPRLRTAPVVIGVLAIVLMGALGLIAVQATTDDPQALLSSSQQVVCGSLVSQEDGSMSVAGSRVEAGAQVEFVQSCGSSPQAPQRGRLALALTGGALIGWMASTLVWARRT